MKMFYGKKLLILGANPETMAIVNKANSMGVTTIVTDYNPSAPAKKIASRSYDVDCLDIPAVIDLALSENVDGVLVGVADVLVQAYQLICDTLKFPCYLTNDLVNVFSNKYNFKRTCEKYGILGIPEYNIKDNNVIPPDIKYPVMVKPVDNCSGKGMSICFNEHELRLGISKAISMSRTGKYLVERFMTCDDLMLYYTFKDGYHSLSMIGDRYTCVEQAGVSPVCVGDCFPSRYVDLYFEKVHNKMCNLFDDLHIDNGVLLIQAFVEEDNFYVYDPGMRLQGCALHLLIDAINGFDQIEMLIEFALTGSMGSIDLKAQDDSLLKGKTAGSLWFLLKEGTIGSISGLSDLHSDSRVINVLQRFDVGDVITKDMIGTEQQVFARLHIVCDTKRDYAETITEFEKKIHVLDTYGNNMLLTGFNPSKLFPESNDDFLIS